MSLQVDYPWKLKSSCGSCLKMQCWLGMWWKRKKWPGNHRCSFCRQRETSQHLFFTCPVARIVWRFVGVTLGTECCPNSYWQYFSWCNAFLPAGEKYYTVGLAAACWAIWLVRNRATFENKMIKTPFKIMFLMCSFILYWARLQQEDNAGELCSSAETMRSNTMQLMKMYEATRQKITGEWTTPENLRACWWRPPVVW